MGGGERTGREDAEEEEGAASRSGISRARLQDVLPRGGGLYDRPLQLQQRIDISGDADMPVAEHGATIISYRRSSDLTRRRVDDADAKRAQRVAHVWTFRGPIRPSNKICFSTRYIGPFVNANGNRYAANFINRKRLIWKRPLKL